MQRCQLHNEQKKEVNLLILIYSIVTYIIQKIIRVIFNRVV